MIIAQIVPELTSGGVERGTVDFAKYLLAQGHGSVVISAGGSLVDDLIQAGVKHYTLPVHRKSLFSVIKLTKTVAKIIEQEKIEVVHARSRVPAWIAFFACRLRKIPLVTTCHGIYSTHGLSHVMGWGRRVIAISHAVSRHMKENFGLSYKRIRLIHRGVKLDEFEEFSKKSVVKNMPATKENDFLIGIVGRITPIKGHRVLLKAMVRVARACPDAQLWVIGEAPRRRYKDELKIITRKMGLEGRVHFLGTRYDVPQLLNHMNVLVAPAVGEEAFGRVMIEAGACGIPVIASRIGGIVDVIDHGKNGILVPAGDAGALAEAILGLYREKHYALGLAKQLKEKVHDVFSDQRMFEKTVKVYEEVLTEQKILVIKFSALGDVILSTGTFSAIRKRYPKAKITALVERRHRFCLRQHPDIDDVISFDKKSWGLKWPVYRLAKLLAQEQFDICIDLQNNNFSHYLAYMSGAHTRVGYATGKLDFFLNVQTPQDKTVLNPVDHQYRALRPLGIKSAGSALTLKTGAGDDATVEQFLKENWLNDKQLLVGINPGSSPQWKTKQWPAERFAALCDSLSRNNIRVVITGTKDDVGIAKQIQQGCRSKPIVAVAKTNVGQLISLIKRCDVFVTSDSAPLHIAASVRTPFVGIFGPTDPKSHVPPTTLPHVILSKELSCSPCYLKKCPVGLKCMRQITEDELLSKIQLLISETKKNPKKPQNEHIDSRQSS